MAINQVDGSNPFVQKCKDIYKELAEIYPKYVPGKNTAFCKMNLDGLGIQELKAISGEKNVSGFCDYIQDVNNRSFSSHYVGPEKDLIKPVNPSDYQGRRIWDRAVDTEFKILDNIDKQLSISGKGTNISGTIELHTVLEPCSSCLDVMRQFCEKYPNINLKVTFEKLNSLYER